MTKKISCPVCATNNIRIITQIEIPNYSDEVIQIEFLCQCNECKEVFLDDS